MKGTLQLKSLQTWITICANSFIKPWVNIMKPKSVRMLGKLSVTQIRDANHKSENPILHFKEHSNKIIDIALTFIRFFFPQTNPVFKLNLVLISILNSFYLFTFRLSFAILRILKFFQCLYSIFIVRTNNILVRLKVLFLLCFQPQNVLIMFLFFRNVLIMFSLTNLSNFDMPCMSYAFMCMLDATFGVWLWPMPNHSFVVKFLKSI